jgi:hypothetical protein
MNATCSGIPVQPAWPEAKQYAIANIPYVGRLILIRHEILKHDVY